MATLFSQLILFLFASFLCTLIFAEEDKSGIYAIGGVAVDGSNGVIESALVKYNITTGNATVLHRSAWNWTEASKQCFDYKNKIWYFIVEQVYLKQFPVLMLARYNIQTNQRLSDISIEEYFSGIFRVDCVADSNTGDVYLFGNKFKQNTTQLLKLTTTNDDQVQFTVIKEYNFTVIFNAKTSPLVGVSPIFDSKRNMAWFNGAIYIDEYDTSLYWYYIDLATGDIKDILSRDQFPFERSGIYDPTIDQIIGLEWTMPPNRTENKNGTWTLEYADPMSLTVTKKMDNYITKYCPWFLHSPAIDISNGIFYEFIGAPIDNAWYSTCGDAWYVFLSEFHLVGINISNGQKLTDPYIVRNYGADFIYQEPFDIIYWDGQ